MYVFLPMPDRVEDGKCRAQSGDDERRACVGSAIGSVGRSIAGRPIVGKGGGGESVGCLLVCRSWSWTQEAPGRGFGSLSTEKGACCSYRMAAILSGIYPDLDINDEVLEVVSVYSEGETDYEVRSVDDMKRFEDLDELQHTHAEEEQVSLGGVGWRSAKEKAGDLQVPASLLTAVKDPHPLEKLKGGGPTRKLRSELKVLFGEMHRLVGFDPQLNSRKSGNASQEILRAEVRTLVARLKQIDPEERMTGLRELLRKRKEQEEEIMQLGLKLSNVLTGNRRGSLRDKASKLQRVLDVMQTELEEGRKEKDEYAKVVDERRTALEKVESELQAVGKRLETLVLHLDNAIIRNKFEEFFVEKLSLQGLLSRASIKVHEVQHTLKCLVEDHDVITNEVKAAETHLRELRTQLIGVNHRIADREMKTVKSRKRAEQTAKRAHDLQLETEDDRVALLDQIQDLYEVQRAMIAEVHQVHGEKAGYLMERLADRNEKAKMNLLAIIFQRKPRNKTGSSSTAVLESDDETSDAGSSARTSLRFEKGLLARLSSRDRRERRNNTPGEFEDSSESVLGDGGGRPGFKRHQSLKRNERKKGMRRGRTVKEESKILYVRNLERARVEESRSIHFLETCVQQRVKTIEALQKSIEEMETYLEATQDELASAEIDREGRLMVKNFNSYNEEVALQEIEKFSTRVGQFNKSLFV